MTYYRKPRNWPRPTEQARVRAYAPRVYAECEECGEMFWRRVWNQRFCCKQHQRRWRERNRRADPVQRAYKNEHARLWYIMDRARSGKAAA